MISDEGESKQQALVAAGVCPLVVDVLGAANARADVPAIEKALLAADVLTQRSGGAGAGGLGNVEQLKGTAIVAGTDTVRFVCACIGCRDVTE